MAPPDQRILKHDLFQSQKTLRLLEQRFGKTSAEYQNALVKITRLWAMLQMTRHQDEFLSQITK